MRKAIASIGVALVAFGEWLQGFGPKPEPQEEKSVYEEREPIFVGGDEDDWVSIVKF